MSDSWWIVRISHDICHVAETHWVRPLTLDFFAFLLQITLFHDQWLTIDIYLIIDLLVRLYKWDVYLEIPQVFLHKNKTENIFKKHFFLKTNYLLYASSLSGIQSLNNLEIWNESVTHIFKWISTANLYDSSFLNCSFFT